MKKSNTNYASIGRFISAINENFRNCIYVTCNVCKHNKCDGCEDVLVAFDADGIPAIISVEDANYIFKTIIDKSECMMEISNAKFICLFANYIKKHTEKEGKNCPLIDIVKGEK